MELVNEPAKLLAAKVLQQAVKDGNFESRDMLGFWCDVVGVEPDAFFARARRKEAIVWPS